MNIPVIFQAIGFKKYTPSTGDTPYNFATIYLTDDCTLNVTDHFDNQEDAVPFKAGFHPIMFKKIRAVSVGSVYLCHCGPQPTLSQLLKA